MSLKIVTGSMYSGKTTKLIELKKDLPDNAQLLIINHSYDDRYTDGSYIVSHDNKKELAVKTSVLNNVHIQEHITHIFIDEIQFFDNQDVLSFITRMLFENKKNIVAAGLVCDINMNDFKSTVSLFKYADEVFYLKGHCTFCDNNSSCTYVPGLSKRGGNIDTIDMEKLNSYNFLPVCKFCWFSKT